MSDRPIALVTGATSGFGFETSRLLAGQGYRVYGTFRNAGKCGPLKELGRTLPVIPIFMDVNKPASVKKAVTAVIRRESRVDVLVNNAGFVVAGFLEDLTDSELKAQFETNVFGLLRVTREVLPIMRKQRKGKIVNIGSISGVVPFPGIGAYIMSKFAVRSVSEGMRQEVWPFGIEVCEIAPGAFLTQVVASTHIGKKARNPNSPYRVYADQVEIAIGKEMAGGKPAVQVAELILQALNDSPMKPVYLAGRDAKISAFFKWLLPDAWFEWLVLTSFPWCRYPKQ
jgi:NAD(P)-dependent dehydrogenase (short-subunit alcohol dehydrogenase family)